MRQSGCWLRCRKTRFLLLMMMEPACALGPQVSGVVATVFGANGFVGSYVTNEIARRGAQIVVPFRCTENGVQHLKQMGDLGQVLGGEGGTCMLRRARTPAQLCIAVYSMPAVCIPGQPSNPLTCACVRTHTRPGTHTQTHTCMPEATTSPPTLPISPTSTTSHTLPCATPQGMGEFGIGDEDRVKRARVHTHTHTCATPQIVLLGEFDIQDEDMVKYAISRSNVVINLIGQRKETMNFDFNEVHVNWPQRLGK